MSYARATAELLAEDELPGFHDRHTHHDAFLVRNRACWLVSASGGETIVGRVSADPSRVFAEQRHWPSPGPDQGRGFASPLPDEGLAIIGHSLVTVYDADTRVRWTHAFEPWHDQDNATAACTPNGTGRRLLITTPSPDAGNGAYQGDLCVALDLADGRHITHTPLPSATAGYVFQQSLTDPHRLFLDALQGDAFYSLRVSLDDDALHTEPVGAENEPFAGVSMAGAVLKLDVGGEWLSRCETGREDIVAEAEEVLPESLRFVGYRPGFLDEDHVLAAAAEEQDTTDNRHLILNGHTLQPTTELDYPGTTTPDPLALGDGTWLTTNGDLVRRWRTTT